MDIASQGADAHDDENDFMLFADETLPILAAEVRALRAEVEVLRTAHEEQCAMYDGERSVYAISRAALARAAALRGAA